MKEKYLKLQRQLRKAMARITVKMDDNKLAVIAAMSPEESRVFDLLFPEHMSYMQARVSIEIYLRPDTNSAIAARFKVCLKTISSHVHAAEENLGVGSKTELIIKINDLIKEMPKVVWAVTNTGKTVFYENEAIAKTNFGKVVKFVEAKE